MAVGAEVPYSVWAGEMVNDPNGFSGIAWGGSLADVPSLVEVEPGNRIQQYESRRHPFRLGDTEVDVLRFISIDRQFARVAVRYHGQRSHDEILGYLQSKYGPIERLPHSMIRGRNQQFTWRGQETEVNLTYNGGQERGYIFIESRTLAPRFNDVLPEHGF
jgi:hypothetical protein